MPKRYLSEEEAAKINWEDTPKNKLYDGEEAANLSKEELKNWVLCSYCKKIHIPPEKIICLSCEDRQKKEKKEKDDAEINRISRAYIKKGGIQMHYNGQAVIDTVKTELICLGYYPIYQHIVRSGIEADFLIFTDNPQHIPIRIKARAALEKGGGTYPPGNLDSSLFDHVALVRSDRMVVFEPRLPAAKSEKTVGKEDES